MEYDYQIDGMLTQGIFVGAVSDNFDERIKKDPILSNLIKG